jgi:hypothetical protein
MRDIGLPEFGSPEDFVDLHDIVKRHAEQDSAWGVEIAQVESMTPGQIQKFMEHPIKAHAVLQCLSAKVTKYRERAVEVKEMLSAPMDQHRFRMLTHARISSSSGQNMRRVIHSSRTTR